VALAVATAMLIAVAAHGQTPTSNVVGDPAKGRALALEECSHCHLVESRRASPPLLPNAPPFIAIANAKETTAASLSTFLNGPHPTMPNFILSQTQQRDVISYILQLRSMR